MAGTRGIFRQHWVTAAEQRRKEQERGARAASLTLSMARVQRVVWWEGLYVCSCSRSSASYEVNSNLRPVGRVLVAPYRTSLLADLSRLMPFHLCIALTADAVIRMLVV